MKNEEIKFSEKFSSLFPTCIRVDGIEYQLIQNELLGGGFSVTYIEYNGESFNYSNQILRHLYVIGKRPKTNFSESGLTDATIYVKSMDSILRDFKLKLKKVAHEVLDEIVSRDTKFYRELTSLLNRYSKENESNTPDYILANYVNGCLNVFNSIIKQKLMHGGRSIDNHIKDELSNDNDYAEIPLAKNIKTKKSK